MISTSRMNFSVVISSVEQAYLEKYYRRYSWKTFLQCTHVFLVHCIVQCGIYKVFRPVSVYLPPGPCIRVHFAPGAHYQRSDTRDQYQHHL